MDRTKTIRKLVISLTAGVLGMLAVNVFSAVYPEKVEHFIAVPRRAHTGIAQSAFGRAFRSAAPQAGRPQGRSRAPCGHGTHRGGPGRALPQLFPCGQRGRHFLGLRLLERRHEEPGRGAHGKLEHLLVRPEQGHGGSSPGSRGRGRSCVPGNGPGGPA